MTSHIKKLITLAVASGLLFFVTLAPVSNVYADAKGDVCDGIALTDSNGGGCNGNADSIGSVVRAGINIISLVAGVAAVIMIIIGGIRYITSGGDANSTAGAKNTIIYALIGLIIVALAQVIVRFVMGKVTTNG